MKRSFPWDDRVDVSVSELESSSPNSCSNGLLATNPIPNTPTIHIPLPNPSTDIYSQDFIMCRIYACSKLGLAILLWLPECIFKVADAEKLGSLTTRDQTIYGVRPTKIWLFKQL